MRDVQQVLDQITGNTSQDLSLDQLRGDVECYRNKPLLIEFDDMPTSMSGYVIPLEDVDLICTNPTLDDLLRQFAILHEMAHLLLYHVPRSIDGPTSTYIDFIRRRDLQHAIRSQIGAFDQPTEDEAEALATLLFDRISKAEGSVPLFSRRLFSY